MTQDSPFQQASFNGTRTAFTFHDLIALTAVWSIGPSQTPVIPSRHAEDLFAGWWQLIEGLGAVPRVLDQSGGGTAAECAEWLAEEDDWPDLDENGAAQLDRLRETGVPPRRLKLRRSR